MVFDPWHSLSLEQLKQLVKSFPAGKTRWSAKVRLFKRDSSTSYPKLKQSASLNNVLTDHPLTRELKSTESRVTEITLSGLTCEEIIRLYEKEDESKRKVNEDDDEDDYDVKVTLTAQQKFSVGREREPKRVQNHPLYIPVSCTAHFAPESGNRFCRDTFQVCDEAYFVLKGNQFTKSGESILTAQEWLKILDTCVAMHCPIFYPSLQNDIEPGGEFQPDHLSPMLANHFRYTIQQTSAANDAPVSKKSSIVVEQNSNQ